MVVAFALLAALVSADLNYRSRHANDYSCFHDGGQVSQFLGQVFREGDKLMAPAPTNMPLRYHSMRLGMDEAAMWRPQPSAQSVLVVSNKPTDSPAEPLFELLSKVGITDEEFEPPVLLARFPYSALYELYRKPMAREAEP